MEIFVSSLLSRHHGHGEIYSLWGLVWKMKLDCITPEGLSWKSQLAILVIRDKPKYTTCLKKNTLLSVWDRLGRPWANSLFVCSLPLAVLAGASGASKLSGRPKQQQQQKQHCCISEFHHKQCGYNPLQLFLLAFCFSCCLLLKQTDLPTSLESGSPKIPTSVFVNAPHLKRRVENCPGQEKQTGNDYKHQNGERWDVPQDYQASASQTLGSWLLLWHSF